MNILVGGLTGSGKTTLSKLLSKDLGLSFVSGSEIRAQFASGKVPAEARKYWLFSAEAAEMDRLRLNDSRVDLLMDAHLRDLVITKSKQIFDVWFLPWLVAENSLKVWLDCPLGVRARRIQEALGLGPVESDLVYHKTSEKDERAQQFAQRTYGVDIFTDRSPFDVIISTETETGVGLIHNVLRIIAENYFGVKKGERRLNSSSREGFDSVIQRCPPDLYPT
jgi:cytidylate kinase